MEDDITPSSEEFDNCLDRSDDTVVTNSDAEMIKLKTELSALKMFVTKQFYLLKQFVGNPKNPSCNCNNSSEIYIKSLNDQIHYLKEENQIKNNIIQSLVHHNPSYTVNNNLPTSSKFNNVFDHSYSNPGNDDPSNNQTDDESNGDNKDDDILLLSETKIDSSFPTAQFHVDGFTIYRYSEIEAFYIELNIRKKKSLLCCSYNPKKNLITKHLAEIGKKLDIFSSKYDNFIILEDLNWEPCEQPILDFCPVYNCQNTIKDKTCFKNLQNPSCMDLIIANR